MSSTDYIYKKYKEDFSDYIEKNEFYEIFNNAIKSGTNSFSYFQRYKESVIDLIWVEAIEEAIIPLDNIIRKPRNFIKTNEEVIPIELSKKITEESVRHLAQHTNYIQKVNRDGTVVPSKILNIFKEENYATYENRFIYTLLINLQYFINKRLKALEESKIQTEYKFGYSGEINIGTEILKYDLKITSTEDITKEQYDFKINQDTSNMDVLMRVERLRKILFDFEKSDLIQTLKGVALVKPPITRTNVLLKDRNFKKCLALWQFIETYRDPGISIKVIEKEEMPSEEYMHDIYNTTLLNYALFNKYNKPNKDNFDDRYEFEEIKPQFNYNKIEEYTDDFSLDIDYVEKIFIEHIHKATAKRKKAEADILKAIKADLKKDKDIKKKFNMQEDKKELQELIKKEKKKKALEKKKLEKGKS